MEIEIYVCTALTKDIQQREREIYLQEVGEGSGRGEGPRVALNSFPFFLPFLLFSTAGGTRRPPRGDLRHDEESNKYLSGLREAKWERSCSWSAAAVRGAGSEGEEGYLTMSVAFQKIICPSSATFPGRRGSNQPLYSSPSPRRPPPVSPLMPLNPEAWRGDDD